MLFKKCLHRRAKRGASEQFSEVFTIVDADLSGVDVVGGGGFSTALPPKGPGGFLSTDGAFALRTTGTSLSVSRLSGDPL